MYVIALALINGVESVTLAGFLGNLVPVTAGNVIGGGVFVAGVYWLCYRYRAPGSAAVEGEALRKEAAYRP